MNFSAILVIISIAVFLGYGAAKYVIYPLLGCEDIIMGEEYVDQQENDLQSQSQNDGVIEDGLDIQQSSDDKTLSNGIVQNANVNESKQIKPTETQDGYYIQFGSFSNRESAQELVQELSTMGIEAEIIEKAGVFKVRSSLFNSQELAREAKATLADTPYFDAFITQ